MSIDLDSIGKRIHRHIKQEDYNYGVKDERERIVKLAKNRICFDHKNGCDHAACYALSDLIVKIEGEQK